MRCKTFVNFENIIELNNYGPIFYHVNVFCRLLYTRASERVVLMAPRHINAISVSFICLKRKRDNSQ